jgi:hypothetical protein
MHNLPEVQDRALSRVPVEVWRNIFEFVTPVPRKYELTTDDAAYVMANAASRAETGIPSSKEAANIANSRFSIIRVCKYWYAIEIQALWSHLRIDLCAEPIRKIKGIQEAISCNATIASYVIRMTLEESRTKPPVASEVLDRPLQMLTSQLPSLQIFVCPCKYARGMAKSSVDIVVLKRDMHPKTFRNVLEQTSYIPNTRMLSIQFQRHNTEILYWNRMLLSRLESLHLQIYSRQMINNLTRAWEIPNIRILSIKSDSVIDILDFIEKWGINIEILELSIDRFEWPRPIQLPKLKELRVSEGIWTSYHITAPKLERFCLLSFSLGGPPTRNHIFKAVDRAKESFLALRRFQFRGLSEDSYPMETAISFSFYDYPNSLDTHSWAEAGLEAHIRSWTEAKLEVDVLLTRLEW